MIDKFAYIYESSLHRESNPAKNTTKLLNVVESRINFIEMFSEFNLTVLQCNEECDKIEKNQSSKKYLNLNELKGLGFDIFSVKMDLLSCDKSKYVKGFGSKYVKSCLFHVSKKIDKIEKSLNDSILKIKHNNVIRNYKTTIQTPTISNSKSWTVE